jgi:hypothetical protein
MHELVQRPASGVLDHEQRLAALTYEFQRSQCPRAVELACELVLVCEAIDVIERRVLGPAERGHKGIPVTLFVIAEAYEYVFGVFPQHFRGAMVPGSVQRSRAGPLELRSL